MHLALGCIFKQDRNSGGDAGGLIPDPGATHRIHPGPVILSFFGYEVFFSAILPS